MARRVGGIAGEFCGERAVVSPSAARCDSLAPERAQRSRGWQHGADRRHPLAAPARSNRWRSPPQNESGACSRDRRIALGQVSAIPPAGAATGARQCPRFPCAVMRVEPRNARLANPATTQRRFVVVGKTALGDHRHPISRPERRRLSAPDGAGARVPSDSQGQARAGRVVRAAPARSAASARRRFRAQ